MMIKNKITKNNIISCKRCLMDSSDYSVQIDADGFCNYCSDFLKKDMQTYQMKRCDIKFANIIEKIKKSGKGKKYDCIVGVSGGVDSCYSAHIANEYGLRILIVHVDNGWNSEVADRNIQLMVNKMGVDYEKFVLDREEFSDLQIAFLKASVPDIENPTDVAILGGLHQVAIKYNIKYIISGGNYETEGFTTRYIQYDSKDSLYIKAIHKKFGTKKLKNFPFFDWKQELYCKLFKGIRMVYILNYLPYSVEDAISILKNNYGWDYYGEKHHESIFTKLVQGYILPKKFNIDYRKRTLSMQILKGKISRDEALIEINKSTYNEQKIQEDIIYITHKLGITLEEFNSIMSLPPKYYFDYPNNEKWLEFIYKFYNKFGSVFSI